LKRCGTFLLVSVLLHMLELHGKGL
jgi:hypothetical protein